MAGNNVQVDISVATKAAEIALSRLKKQTDDNTSSWNVFKGAFGANLATAGISKAFEIIKSTVASFINEASQAEQSLKNMEVALSNAGLLTPKVSKDFQDLSSSIQATTKYSEDQVQASVGLLASLTNLSADGIKQASLAAVDLAATLNVDLATATEMISKAVNGNTIAFGKLGIQVEKGSTDAERLTKLMSALSSQQGTAAAQAQTFAGATEIASNAQGELFEAFGKMITTSPLVIKALQSAGEILISLAGWVDENSQNIKLFGESVVAAAALVGTYFLIMEVAALGLSASFAIVAKAAIAAWGAITAPVTVVVAAIALIGLGIYAIIKYWDNLRAVMKDVQAEMLELAAVAAGLFSQDLADSLRQQSNEYRNQATAIRDVIKAKEDETAANSQSAKEAEALKKQEEENLQKQKVRRAEELAEVARDTQEKLNLSKKYNEEVRLAEAERLLSIEEITTQHKANMLEIEGLNTQTVLENQLANQATALAAHQEHERQVLQASIDAELAKANLVKDTEERKKAILEASNKGNIERIKLQAKQEVDAKKLSFKTEEDLAKNKVANTRDTLSAISTLQNSKTKELAAVGKAAAIYNIGISTAEGISKAWSLGPILGPIGAALVAAAGAVQAAQVAGLNFASGGIVPGNSYAGDNVRANLNSREMILNQFQQKKLFDLANGKKQSTQENQNNYLMMAELVQEIRNQPISIEIDGKAVFTAVRSQLDSGRGFA